MQLLKIIGTFFLVIGAVVLSLTHTSTPANIQTVVSTSTSSTTIQQQSGSVVPVTNDSNAIKNTTATGVKVYTDVELLALADNTFADGTVPLGDYKYVTTGPKKGYVYLCNVHKDNPGSMVLGSWVHGESWNFLQKVSVDGSVSWPQAVFSNIISGSSRILSGNDLPINHTTGIFPVQKNDDAVQFDPNPNTITAQVLKKSLPANPVYSAIPYCMGGEVGIMLSGVALFNAFDAGLRDAPAHELQDSCDGHPQGSGEYHYHSLPSCFKDLSVKTVIGYAYDGFPITGPQVATNKYLTTEDLDECHGLTSEVFMDGKKVVTYHYVMTRDFPYSASCFRGKPISTGPSVSGGQAPQNQSGTQTQNNQGGNGEARTPPQEAINVCNGKQDSSSCSFVSPHGDTIMGVCRMPPNSSLACVPQ